MTATPRRRDQTTIDRVAISDDLAAHTVGTGSTLWTERSAFARLWWAAILLLAAVAGVAYDIPILGVRVASVCGFFLWAPGALLLGSVPAIGRLPRIALSSGMSVAILLLGADLLVQTGHWHPRTLTTAEVSIVGAFALAGLVTTCRPSRGAPEAVRDKR